MPLLNVAPIVATVEIDAPATKVWALVSDLRNMRRWSPQNARTFLRGDGGVGTRMVNINRRGLLVWPTQSEVVRFAPEKEIAFRVKENFTVWSYELEDLGDGRTGVTYRLEVELGRMLGMVVRGPLVDALRGELVNARAGELKERVEGG